MRFISLYSALTVLALPLSLAVADGDKSPYSLFEPTPPEQMREMITDRPDITESPYTVDAGHFQVELSAFEYSGNKQKGSRVDNFAVLPSNIKVGLLPNTDIQFVFTPYERDSEKADGNKRINEGFSDDTQIRLKMNIWGNDEGETAFALMPFIKFPTGHNGLNNNHTEGGVIAPFAIALSDETSLGLMAEIDLVYNEDSEKYGSDFVHTATIGHPIYGDLAGFLEYVGVAPYRNGSSYQPTASAGITYQVTNNLILDLGGTAGMSESANDYRLYCGSSFRY